MNEPTDTVFLEVLFEGSDVTLDVVSATVEDHDTLIDEATVVVSDPHRTFTDFVREGMTVRVAMGWSSQHAVLFEGAATRVRGQADRDGRRFVTIVALDPCEAMHRTPRFRHHTGTVSAIVQAIAQEYGLTVEQVALDHDPTFEEETPLRQAHQTDWEFLLDLARRYEARTFVEYDESGSRFYFVSTATLLQATPVGALSYGSTGGTLLRFGYRRAAERASARLQARVVDPSSGEVQATSATQPVTPDAPVPPDAGHAAALGQADSAAVARYNAVATLHAAATGNPADRRPTHVAAGLASDTDAIERAGLRPDDPSALGWVARGLATGSVLLQAKSTVTMEGVGAWADGDWYIACARHTYRDRRYLTEFFATR